MSGYLSTICVISAFPTVWDIYLIVASWSTLRSAMFVLGRLVVVAAIFLSLSFGVIVAVRSIRRGLGFWRLREHGNYFCFVEP